LNVATGHASHAPDASRKPALQRHEPAAVAVAGCEFAGHAAHAPSSVAPVAAEYVPAAQFRQVVLEVAATVSEYVPAAQSRQVVLEAAPTVPEYVPATQLRQVVLEAAATVSEYVPATQSRHTVLLKAPMADECLPSAQSVHAAEPVNILYFPATHASHVPPSGPVNPRLHTQLVSAVDPATDCESAGHC
jgi:hypothetical protein